MSATQDKTSPAAELLAECRRIAEERYSSLQHRAVYRLAFEAGGKWMLARLSAEPAGAGRGVPDGWRLVPVEPTEEMILALPVNDVLDGVIGNKTSRVVWAAQVRVDWRAMLAAAQPPPAPATQAMQARADIEAGAQWLAKNVMLCNWEGLPEGTCAPEYPPWKVGGHYNAGREDYRIAVRAILAAAIKEGSSND